MGLCNLSLPSPLPTLLRTSSRGRRTLGRRGSVVRVEYGRGTSSNLLCRDLLKRVFYGEPYL